MMHVSEGNDRYITRQTLPQIWAGVESSHDGKFPTHTSKLILNMYTTSHQSTRATNNSVNGRFGFSNQFKCNNKLQRQRTYDMLDI